MPDFARYQLPYEKLRVWHSAKDLAKRIYGITQEFPPTEKFSLANQMNRAAVSVMSNIAEGTSRLSRKDQAHFSEVAYGSLMELACQLHLAQELGFVTLDCNEEIKKQFCEVAAMINALRNSQLKQV